MFPLILYSPSYEAVFCYICGRQRVAVARYRMICLVFNSLKANTARDSEGD